VVRFDEIAKHIMGTPELRMKCWRTLELFLNNNTDDDGDKIKIEEHWNPDDCKHCTAPVGIAIHRYR
jgi:hypothetical protein